MFRWKTVLSILQQEQNGPAIGFVKADFEGMQYMLGQMEWDELFAWWSGVMFEYI